MNIGGADRAPRDENDPPRPPLRAVPGGGVPAPGSGTPPAGPPRLTPVPGTGPGGPPAGPPRLTPVPPRPATPQGPPRLDAASATPLPPANGGTIGPAWLQSGTGAPVRGATPPPPPAPPRTPAAPLPAAAVEPVPARPAPTRLAVVRGTASQLAALIWRKLEERRAAIGHNGQRVSRSLMVSSGIALALFLALIFVIPAEYRAPVEVVMPPPTRTVVLEPLPEPPPATEAPRMVETAPVMVPDVAAVPSSEKLEPPKVRRRAVDPEAGKAGRERARKATAELASATRSLDQAIGDLSSSLGASGGEVVPTRRARRRNVNGGRSDGELAGLEAGLKGGASADVGGSAVEGKLVALGSLGVASGSSATDEPGGSSGAAPGVYRSNASLLAVIQKYAPGIQYCYETELKREPGKRGKLVVSMTVSAEGRVVQASVVQNTVGSERLASCALSQIRDWKFPAIAGGLTTFQAPFLFTPPE